jgi:hypothetical protein
MENNSLYQTYASTPARNIPSEYLLDLTKAMLAESALDMGTDFEDRTADRVKVILAGTFGFLPLALIASAFKRGALGHYGAGRLVPRTIYGWMNEIKDEYNREIRHKEEDKDQGAKYDGLERYPMGTAIMKKIDWLSSGAITSDQYDAIKLKEVARRIAARESCTLADFGIYNQ